MNSNNLSQILLNLKKYQKNICILYLSQLIKNQQNYNKIMSLNVLSLTSIMKNDQFGFIMWHNDIDSLSIEIKLFIDLINSNSQSHYLPTQIGLFVNSVRFNSAYGQLQCLPTEIGLLINLIGLYLENNHLKYMPTEIGLLSKLQEIYIWKNQLGKLPSEIGLLSNLASFSFYNNQIEELPTEIGLLKKMEYLHMHNNKFILPTEISLLTNLKYISICDHQLNYIPTEIFKKLSQFSIKNNKSEKSLKNIGVVIEFDNIYSKKNKLFNKENTTGLIYNLNILEKQLNDSKINMNCVLVNLKKWNIGETELKDCFNEITIVNKLKEYHRCQNILDLPSQVKSTQKMALVKIAD